MRDSTITERINESKRIYRALVWWTAVLITSIIILFRAVTTDNLLLFTIGTVAGIVALVAIALNIIMVGNLNNNIDANKRPPPRRPLRDEFRQEQRPPRIELTRGNTMLLSKHHPDYGTWGTLGDTLEKHNWRFSRDIIAGSFKRITERYPEIRKDFRRLDFVKGRGANQYCTRLGQTFFIEQSNNLSLEHMRVRK